jgi:hypothetical protein
VQIVAVARSGIRPHLGWESRAAPRESHARTCRSERPCRRGRVVVHCRRLGYQAMDETRVNWWMDASSHWHRGLPPEDWWQAEDGRWHPPGDDDPTGEMRDGPPAGAAHFAGGARSPDPEAGWGWPGWARAAVLASVALVAVVAVAAAAITDGGGGDDEARTTTTLAGGSTAGPTTEVPQTTSTVVAGASGEVVDPSAPTTDRSSTTRPTSTSISPPISAAPAPTRPPSSAGLRPGAPCSPVGATAVSDSGEPMTCTVEKCRGAPFDEPRWRRTTC